MHDSLEATIYPQPLSLGGGVAIEIAARIDDRTRRVISVRSDIDSIAQGFDLDFIDWRDCDNQPISLRDAQEIESAAHERMV